VIVLASLEEKTMTQSRSIKATASMNFRRMSPDFAAYSPRSSLNVDLDPFINFDEFHMSAPTFPPHPHAGFSVMTYLFEDSEGAIINRDSFGDHSRIEPGGLHWTQAGRGAQHEENPERPYRNTHGLQLWVNHSRTNRMVEPKAIHAKAAQIPQAFPNPGARVRILAGSAYGQSATFTPVTPITLLNIHLEPNVSLTLPAPSQHTALLSIVRGSASSSNTVLETHSVAVFASDADSITIQAGADGLEALFGIGEPLREPTVFGGPFVGSSQQDIFDARQRFQRGEMGYLESSA
jgi:redox-sensitive bicupin YhaK (pirin superfamily)